MSSFSQNSDSHDDTGRDKLIMVYDFCNHDAEYPGGFCQFYETLYSNLVYPGEARALKIQGILHVRFTVDELGNMTDLKFKNKLGYGIEESVLRAMQKLSIWVPADIEGQTTAQNFILPITYKLY